MNLKKSEDSNQRRLEALSRQADEFKQKRNQIRTDLLNIVSHYSKSQFLKFLYFNLIQILYPY